MYMHSDVQHIKPMHNNESALSSSVFIPDQSPSFSCCISCMVWPLTFWIVCLLCFCVLLHTHWKWFILLLSTSLAIYQALSGLVDCPSLSGFAPHCQCDISTGIGLKVSFLGIFAFFSFLIALYSLQSHRLSNIAVCDIWASILLAHISTCMLVTALVFFFHFNSLIMSEVMVSSFIP